MMNPRLICSVAAAIALSTASAAQEAIPTQVPPAIDAKAVAQDVALMQEALKLRSDMAGAVASGAEKPEAALERLRTASFPGGMKLSADAGFAYAAIDLGQRLVLRHPAEAEEFFRAAEAALASEVSRTDDAEAKDKAQHLQSLAMIRSNYLNKAEQAQADMAAAVKLRPEDKYLAQFQKTLAARTAKPGQALVKKEGSQ